MEPYNPRLDSSHKEFYQWWDKLWIPKEWNCSPVHYSNELMFEEIARMAWAESKKVERNRCLEIASKHKVYGWDTWGQCSTSIANEIEEG